MTAQPLHPLARETDPWDHAYRDVCRWRGACQQQFAEAENAVGQLLLSLRDAGYDVRLERMVGQRFKAINSWLERSETKQAKIAAAHLASFSALLPFRNLISHTSALIALDRNGKWIALFRGTAFANAAAQPLERSITQSDADDEYAKLVVLRRQLCSSLGQVRKALQPA